MAKVSKWKEALGVLRKSSGSNSEVALAASKFLKSLPSTKTLSKLSSDAKALDKKYKSMPGTQPKENFAKDYAKNTKLLPKTIAASVSFQIRVPALKNKLNKIIAKHGG